MSYSVPWHQGQTQHGVLHGGLVSAWGHQEPFAIASSKIPAWDSGFSFYSTTNESLGFSFPFRAFEGVLGNFSVLMGSSGSDFVAIHEGHEEKLDFAGKL